MTATKDDLYHVGLTDDEVRKSRTEHGVNLLTPPKHRLCGNFIWKSLKTRSKSIAGGRFLLFDYFHSGERICRNNRYHSCYFTGYGHWLLF